MPYIVNKLLQENDKFLKKVIFNICNATTSIKDNMNRFTVSKYIIIYFFKTYYYVYLILVIYCYLYWRSFRLYCLINFNTSLIVYIENKYSIIEMV